jgi:hypothetical protein
MVLGFLGFGLSQKNALLTERAQRPKHKDQSPRS